MGIGIKVDQTRDSIRQNAKGTIDLERSLEAEGYEMKVFLGFGHAIEWFSEVVPLDEARRLPH